MLYILYDDKRTVDARVRLGIYKQVVEAKDTSFYRLYDRFNGRTTCRTEGT